MKRFLTYLIITLLISLSFVRLNASSWPKIYLLRHAKVSIANPGWGNADTAREYKENYNNSPVEKQVPDELRTITDSLAYEITIFTSALSRSQHTARLLFGDSIEIISDARFNEPEYPVLNNRIIKLPVKLWLSLSRVMWVLNVNKKDVPGIKQARENIGEIAGELIELTKSGKNVLIVGHGLFNRMMVKELKNCGWKLERFEGYHNLSLNCLVNN